MQPRKKALASLIDFVPRPDCLSLDLQRRDDYGGEQITGFLSCSPAAAQQSGVIKVLSVTTISQDIVGFSNLMPSSAVVGVWAERDNFRSQVPHPSSHSVKLVKGWGPSRLRFWWCEIKRLHKFPAVSSTCESDSRDSTEKAMQGVLSYAIREIGLAVLQMILQQLQHVPQKGVCGRISLRLNDFGEENA